MKGLAYSVLAGVVIWLLPAPVGVTLKAWHLLAHFVATIVGIITSVRAPPGAARPGRPAGAGREAWRRGLGLPARRWAGCGQAGSQSPCPPRRSRLAPVHRPHSALLHPG
jgi:hypothetical protein